MAYGRIWEGRLRRLAAGIDITARGVTVVVLGHGWRARQPVRLEGLAWLPLAPGVVHGTELLDRTALVEALCAAFNLLPRSCKRAVMRCAMALPAALTQVSSLPLEQLALDVRPDDDDELLTELEPLALAEAERMTGLERGDLAVDWRVAPGEALTDDGEPARCLTITAAANEHLQARLECAAQAGLTLCAVDGEAHAALRAMRYLAAFTVFAQAPQKSCIALWAGPDSLYGWFLAEAGIVREMCYPSPEYATLTDALQELQRKDRPDYALLSGDPDLLAKTQAAQVSGAASGNVLACPVLPFECARFATSASSLPSAAPLLHAPACAVAFGLALRGVNE